MSKESLQELLVRKVQTATSKTLENNGKVDGEELAALARLAELVELRNRTQNGQKRWVLGLSFCVPVFVVGIFLFARVWSVKIELDTAMTGVGFVLPSEQVLVEEPIRLSALGLSGLRAVSATGLLLQGSQDPTIRTQEANALSLLVPTNDQQQKKGAITLNTLVLPAETEVRLQRGEQPAVYILSLLAPELTFEVGVHGSLEITTQGSGKRQIEISNPESIKLMAGQDEVDLVLTPAEEIPITFVSQLLARDLSFLRVDLFEVRHATIPRRVSTLLSGRLYQESLNGQERLLRPGENLRFESSDGQIRSLTLEKNNLSMQFYGRVRGMKTGWGKGERNLMPTYLQWLAAQPGIYLFWGTALYLFGMIVTVLRWWGVRA